MYEMTTLPLDYDEEWAALQDALADEYDPYDDGWLEGSYEDTWEERASVFD